MPETINFDHTNDELVEAFTNVMWVEESALRNGPFSDLTVKEVHTVDAISMYEEKSASQVAKIVHLTPSAMTTAIDRLVDKGYVERRRSLNDRRVVKLGLTHKGRVVYRAHQAFHRGVTHSLFKGTDNAQALVLVDAIHNLKEYLKSLISAQ
ncbi:MarR family winged helix-turn-helix transcriptional regulator [Eupransor demetentiae]|uniref:MarR family (MarR) n=1 Tax=Eupransor demetentiae TaxID=3109584 RepID=A0ABP0EQ74_9LACO|nr:DNA-binding transcriptional regulator [Lactobacillaceae bacterium LMG 33000]